MSKIARAHVTVSLSGDGGDELFGGYPLLSGRADMEPARPVASPGSTNRSAESAGLPALWSAVIRAVGLVFPRRWPVSNSRDRVRRLAEFLYATSPSQLYGLLVSHWSEPAKLVRDAPEPLTALTDPGRQAELRHNSERMMYTDLVSYLPGDILTKMDRASMAVGLEARVPLLDHRVVEFAWQLPLDLKIKDGQGKCILREILYKYVPRKLIERPKQGFGIPIGHWLHGPLREWTEGLLDDRLIRGQGCLNPDPIRTMWSNHLSGRVDEQYRLWDVLMFQAWLEQEGKSRNMPAEQAPTEVAVHEGVARPMNAGTAADAVLAR